MTKKNKNISVTQPKHESCRNTVPFSMLQNGTRNTFEIRETDSSSRNFHSWKTWFPKYLRFYQKEYNLLPLQILNLGNCLFFVIVFSFVMCILHIWHSDILKRSNYLQKIIKPKKIFGTKTNVQRRFRVPKTNPFSGP